MTPHHPADPCVRSGQDQETPMDTRQQYQRDYYLQTLAAAGKAPRQPAEPVRAHIRALTDTGMTYVEIAEACGLHRHTIGAVARGENGTVRAHTAQAILAVRPALTLIGAIRRVRALTALGWSAPAIAQAGQITTCTVGSYRRGEAQFLGPGAVGVVRAWKALSMRVPAQVTRYEKSMVTRSQAWARREGWAPPLAWDNIDDPNERPNIGEKVRGFDLDDWARLVQWGETPRRAAERAGVTIDAVNLRALRTGRADILDLIRGAAA